MNLDFKVIKSDILSSLRSDISSVIKQELKNVLAEDFDTLKSKLQVVKAEIAKPITAIQFKIEQMKGNIQDMEEGLSTLVRQSSLPSNYGE